MFVYILSLNGFLDFLSAMRYLTAKKKLHSYIKGNEERFCAVLRDEKKDCSVQYKLFFVRLSSSVRIEVQNKMILRQHLNFRFYQLVLGIKSNTIS